MALLAIIWSQRPADHTHAYGHGKVEYFSSGMEGVLICCAAVGIVVAALRRFADPQPIQALGEGLVLAAIAGGLILWLRGFCCMLPAGMTVLCWKLMPGTC